MACYGSIVEGIAFREVFEASPNPYMVLDRDLRYVAANRAYLALIGMQLDELVGRHPLEVFPHDPSDPANASWQRIEDSLRTVLRTRQPDVLAHLVYRVPRTPGGALDERVWSATHTPILDAHGEVAFILQHTQDVTGLTHGGDGAATVLFRAEAVERENAEIENQVRMLRALLAQAPGFMAFVRGPSHVIELTNPAYDRMIGRTGLIGQRAADVLPYLIQQGFGALLDRVYETGEAYTGTGTRLVITRPDGTPEERFVDFLYQPVRGSDGAIIGVLVHGHDVTAQKRGELRQQFLTRATERLASATEGIEDALRGIARAAVETFTDWAIVDLYDDATSRRLIVAHADPAGAEVARGLMDYPTPIDNPPSHAFGGLTTHPRLVENITSELIESTARSPRHAQLIRDAGTQNALTVPLLHRGRTYGLLALVNGSSGRHFDAADVPAMEELARVLAAGIENARLLVEREDLLAREQAARERAEAASRAKDDFLAMLGHELRNPLAPILTAVQLMRLRGETTSEREQGVIERQAQHMVRLVDDLLDVSRIARGKIELRTSPVETAVIVAKGIEMASHQLEQKGHQLTVEVPARGLRVLGDEARLSQVIANLLTNAARYTPPGGHVWVTAARDEREVIVRVRDNGTGIPPDLIPKIFDLFVQGPRKGGNGGLGRGLTLVRRLVELHDGSVGVSSAGPGHGAEFLVRLALLMASGPAAADAAREGRPPVTVSRRVLIVDDNVDAATLLAELLARRGHQTFVAHDGLDALRIAIEEEPEIAVLDIGLPTLDGYALAAKMRESLGNRAPRLIAVTGYGAEHDREKSRRAGFEAHLTKPVETATLLRLLDPARAA